MLKNKKRKEGCKKRWRQKTRKASGNEASTEIKKGLYQFTARPSPVSLYDEYRQRKKKKYLTPASILQAANFIKAPGFRIFNRPDSHVMIFDEYNQNQLVGIFQFTPFSKMTPDQREDLDFLAGFFHSHKKYVNPVSNFNSACLGGKMNMLGWRKCMKPNERAGLFLSQAKINKDVHGFTSVVRRGHQAGVIIGKSFKDLADNVFAKNHDIMVEYDMPSFGDATLDDLEVNNFSAASSLSYTYGGFYNSPHTDNQDVSEFAYVQWIPTFAKTGKVATHAEGFNVVGGEFVFPDCRFGLGFENLDGVARMVWRSTDYKHFTMFSQPNSTFNRLAFSLQLNKKTVNVFKNIKTQEGAYLNMHDGDLNYILATAEKQKKLKVDCSLCIC
ncbi:hypothetical protein PGT21_031851 [Puccinia graminis f. sp. tritici]|uniref:Tet-like 2OG-Fe(II) oxygenase domain-containing protein n=1 Tax=Puccinia graminis f. sp. tritici TaxID=56615 RepID=A0A5B0NF92_PUCGR|nr:hypothetical protein PGT21_031851 [Puccinia graminis f. sp. tritici]